ncbi:MAG: DMT family transporter [Propionibacteriaceae bacterium]|jgi:drug/metabolite transporter (DMT)-like permease|nr:DMT family transporter [Propionibacteriaceae bacterium]
MPEPTRQRSLAQRLAPWALLVMAVLWGSTFFSIKRLVTVLPPEDFLAVRYLMSTIVLVAVFHRQLRMGWRTFGQGVCLGLLWAAAQLLQTIGLTSTPASISGFITGLYVVATPVLGFLVFRFRITAWVWLAVVLATAGLGVLTLRSSGSGLGLGELLTLGSALIFALHILLLGRWSTPTKAGPLTCAQGIAMTVVFFIFAVPGGIQVPTTAVNWIWMVYLAVFCGAITLLLQTWAQSHVEPSKAAVIMCSEPLWATLFAMAFGGERPTWLFAIGAAAILAAMALVIRHPTRVRAKDSSS